MVYQQAGCKKPFTRLWLSSMEENAIREGFAQMCIRDSYDVGRTTANGLWNKSQHISEAEAKPGDLVSVSYTHLDVYKRQSHGR